MFVNNIVKYAIIFVRFSVFLTKDTLFFVENARIFGFSHSFQQKMPAYL